LPTGANHLSTNPADADTEVGAFAQEQVMRVRVGIRDIEVIYGNASTDETGLAQWHSCFRLSGDTLDFGKLTMHHVDLTMIDASQHPWFDLDLVHYQAQLVNGYTRMTVQAGVEISCLTSMSSTQESQPEHHARMAQRPQPLAAA